MTSRTMSVMQWKLLTNIKEYLAKISPDKTFQNIISKEFAQILQKVQPNVYGRNIIRFESTTLVPTIDNKNSASEMVGNVINGIKMKMSNSNEEPQVPKEVVPRWKNEVPSITKNSIMSRTRHVIDSIVNAETEESRLKRIEELSFHIHQYPEAKNAAVKEGAIRLLLRIRGQTQNPIVIGAINEVFALLGHCDPLPGRGIRILSIDGGGIRGILVIQMLKKLEELTGKRVYEMFDYVCGVSTGAILACSLGAMQRTCDQLHKDYLDISTKIFTQSTIKGTSSLVWSHSYYDTELWEKLLIEQMGDISLISTTRTPNCPKLSTVSAVVNHERVSAYVFRNYSLPYRVQSQYQGGNDHKLWQAARASAAAPTYFGECKLGNLLHQDGGILVNNPTAVAIHEAKLLWPNTPIQCVVSFGTGRSVPTQSESFREQPANVSSWKNKFLKILDSATDTEGVHTMLSDLLPEDVYFRFNPYLTEMLSMSEIEPKKIEQLERDALMYLRRNEDKFQRVAKALLEKRSITQKIADLLYEKKELLGFTSKL
ncbi:PREDICTED: calcium-independent phospholipase A2-gamma-like isoform X2 [Nicrophorus vespilloides]|nr:PREDICTED: calcium-independent phospholipase A2-gamma-like isoform X2 [Nicrophorus vespilloides]